MGTTAEKLQKLRESKQAIKAALESKGKTPGENLSGYANLTAELVAVEGVDGKTITGTIPSKTAETIIPTTEDQTIAAGQYLAGAQTIKGDVNLRPENIRKGVTLMGVTGVMEPGSYETIIRNPETRYFSESETIPKGTAVTYDEAATTPVKLGNLSTLFESDSRPSIFYLGNSKFLVVGEMKINGAFNNITAKVVTFNGSAFSGGTTVVLSPNCAMHQGTKFNRYGEYIIIATNIYADFNDRRLYFASLKINDDNTITIVNSIIARTYDSDATTACDTYFVSDTGCIVYSLTTQPTHTGVCFVKSDGSFTTPISLGGNMPHYPGYVKYFELSNQRIYLFHAQYSADTVLSCTVIKLSDTTTDAKKDACTLTMESFCSIGLSALDSYASLTGSYYHSIFLFDRKDKNVVVLYADTDNNSINKAEFSLSTGDKISDKIVALFSNKVSLCRFFGFTGQKPNTHFFAVNAVYSVDEGNSKAYYKTMIYQAIWSEKSLKIVPYTLDRSSYVSTTSLKADLKRLSTSQGFINIINDELPIYGNTYMYLSGDYLYMRRLGNIIASNGGHILGVTEEDISREHPGKITITNLN